MLPLCSDLGFETKCNLLTFQMKCCKLASEVPISHVQIFAQTFPRMNESKLWTDTSLRNKCFWNSQIWTFSAAFVSNFSCRCICPESGLILNLFFSIQLLTVMACLVSTIWKELKFNNIDFTYSFLQIWCVSLV
jgi:hypothetical protein